MIHVPAGRAASCSTTRWSTGTTPPSPSPASAAGRCIGRAGACSAGRARSTACSRSAAIRRTTTAGRRWAAGLVVRGGAALFQVDRALWPGEEGQRGKSGPILVEDYRTTLRPDAPVRRCRAAGRHSADQGPQRQPARGRRLLADVAQRPLPRLDRAHLPGTGAPPAEPAGRDRGRSPPSCCSRASAASASPSARTGKDRRVMAGARGDPVGRHHQLAAPAAGLGHRAGRAPEVDRRRRRPRPAGRRRQSVGPLRRPHLAPGQGRGVDQRAVAPASAGGRGRALADDRARRADLRRHPARRRSPAAARGWPAPTSSCCSRRQATTTNKFGELEREPGMTVAVSIARPESRGTIMAQSADPFVRPVAQAQLPVGAQRPARVARRRGPGAPHLRGSSAGASTAWRRSRPAPASPPRRRLPITSASRARRSITSSAPARWARTRWRWSIPG